jgi:uncharacterized protein DUF955
MRIAALRQILRLTGFPSARDVWQLARLLREEGRIEVEITPCLCAYTQRLADGRALITLPEHMDEREQAEAMLEELGHVELGEAASDSVPRRLTERSRRRLRLLWEDREENHCEAFRLAWKLPLDLVSRYADDEELARDSGCSLEQVRRRREMIRRKRR